MGLNKEWAEFQARKQSIIDGIDRRHAELNSEIEKLVLLRQEQNTECERSHAHVQNSLKEINDLLQRI